MLKKFLPLVVRLLLLALIIIGGFKTKLISNHDLCGWRPGAMAEVIGKEWPCRCIGTTETENLPTYQKTYCTGINLSYNRCNNLITFRSSQVPRYTTEGRVFTLYVKPYHLGFDEPATYGDVLVRDKEGKIIREQPLRGKSEAVFQLPEGNYTITMRGNTGRTNVALKENTTVDLEVVAVNR